jgi:hypothetical protein
MVMVVFTMPDFDYVFKVIKDAFPYPKRTTRSDVMGATTWCSSMIARDAWSTRRSSSTWPSTATVLQRILWTNCS